MQHFKLALVGTISTICCFANAGTTTITEDPWAGIFDLGNANIRADAHDHQSFTQNGLGSTGLISADAAVSDPIAGSVDAFERISANITSETSVSVSFSEGWHTALSPNQGFVLPNGIVAYDFATAAPSVLYVDFLAQITSDQADEGGMSNAWIRVDGVDYPTEQYYDELHTGLWSRPRTSGGWTINLSGGNHTILFMGESNLSAGLYTQNSTIDETLNFHTAAVPEPSALLGLCGGLGLFCKTRRRRRNSS